MEGLLANIGDIIQNQGWLAFPACFLAGIISSASPCVLAMIPLVIGYVGGYAEGSQRKAIQYSLVFVLGLTITFTVLGIIAGAMGRLFGDVGGFWNYVLPPVAILLGLYLLLSEVLNLNIGISQRFMPKKRALIGAFLMGLFFGILASPCATPVLAVILTFAATQKEIAYSGGLLLAYALGHWVLVLGAGISAGFAQRVLESRGISNFSSYSKKAAGVILIGVGIYLFIYLL
ncbi:MAG: sulfite exporter TauE/SafE family protein [Deltaproteobacteria bacterium]|nr:sulfite exporter TauE/SafE family protein [Deltaproteobacteria bacterium]